MLVIGCFWAPCLFEPCPCLISLWIDAGCWLVYVCYKLFVGRIAVVSRVCYRMGWLVLLILCFYELCVFMEFVFVLFSTVWIFLGSWFV